MTEADGRPIRPPAITRIPPMAMAGMGIFLLTLMDGLVKDLAGRYGTVQLTFLRFAVTAAMGIVVFVVLRTPLPGRGALAGNLVRGLFVAGSALGFFYGLGALPITEVFAISYLGPILVALIAIPVLGERLSGRTLGGLILGLAGVLVTIGQVGTGMLDPARLAGAGAVLFAAATYAASVVLLRRQMQRDALMTVVVFQSAVPACLLGLPAAFAWGDIAAADLPLFGLVGALGLAGHVALALAFRQGEASRLAAVEYTGIVWAALIGLIAFAEVPSLATIIGAILVVAACFIVRR